MGTPPHSCLSSQLSKGDCGIAPGGGWPHGHEKCTGSETQPVACCQPCFHHHDHQVSLAEVFVRPSHLNIQAALQRRGAQDAGGVCGGTLIGISSKILTTFSFELCGDIPLISLKDLTEEIPK